MFLDERLKAIYEEKISKNGVDLLSTARQGVFEIIDTCFGELPPPNSMKSFCVALKQVPSAIFSLGYAKIQRHTQ